MVVHLEVCIDKFKGTFRADRDAAPAVAADITVNRQHPSSIGIGHAIIFSSGENPSAHPLPGTGAHENENEPYRPPPPGESRTRPERKAMTAPATRESMADSSSAGALVSTRISFSQPAMNRS